MSEVETTTGLWKTYDFTLVAGTKTIKTDFAEIYDQFVELQSGQSKAGGEQLLATYGAPGIIPDSLSDLGDGSREEQVLFSYSAGSGNAAVADDLLIWVAGKKGVVTNVEFTVLTDGDTSGATTVDVEKGASAGGGTSIFSAAPSIAHDAGAFTIANGTLSSTAKYFEANDIFHVNCNAIPGGTTSTGISVTVYGYFTGGANDVNVELFYAGDITKVLTNVGTLGADFYTSLQYAFQDDGTVFTDYSSEAKEATDNDVKLLPATPVADDAFYFGIENSKFQKISFVQGTDGSIADLVVAWQYYNGTAWTTLSVTDGTTGFSDLTGTVTWTIPSDWAQVTINSQSAFWVRCVVVSLGAVTTQPQAKSVDLGLSVIFDVNVAGTSIWNTNQENRPHHYDNDSANYVITTSFDDASFAAGEAITVDIDYAAPSSGTEPQDAYIEIWGTTDSGTGAKEELTFTITNGNIVITSNNPQSTSQYRLSVRGRY
jgi:hypothetical protein